MLRWEGFVIEALICRSAGRNLAWLPSDLGECEDRLPSHATGRSSLDYRNQAMLLTSPGKALFDLASGDAL